MRYYELSEEEKKKYGPELFEIVEEMRKYGLKGRDNIDNHVLVGDEDSEDGRGWIYYPDID